MVKDAVATAGGLELHGYLPAAVVRERAPTFDEVYGEHARFVWRVLRGMGIREAGIDDAVQDVFIVVHRRLREFDGKHALSTWLFAIAYRVACDHRRKHRRVSSLDPLDDEKRALIVLAELEEQTVPQIAAITGSSVNTIYTRLRRARLELQAALMKRGAP